MGLVLLSLPSRVSPPDLASVQATHLLDATKHISLVWEPLSAALLCSTLSFSNQLSFPLHTSHHVSSPTVVFSLSFSLCFFFYSLSPVFSMTVLKFNLVSLIWLAQYLCIGLPIWSLESIFSLHPFSDKRDILNCS